MIILSTCSARPNFVKLAAVHHALKKHPQIKHVIVHTGQHYDPLFSDIFFEQLAIPLPDINLGIKGGERMSVIGSTEAAMGPVLKKVKPDLVLVYGDVNGAVGAALAAKKAGVRIGHVEAGLRSFDESMPEELNRIEIDRLAEMHFVSEAFGMQQLVMEKLTDKALLVGNTMIDTLVRMLPLIEEEPLPVGVPKEFIVATIHRPSNVDTAEMLQMNLKFLSELGAKCPVVLPLHHRTKAAIKAFGLQSAVGPGLTIIEPLGYIAFLALVRRARCILTDSGGIQEEATFLKKKCFTMRRNTERPSTIESGSNSLIDPANAADRAAVLAFASKPSTPMITIPPLWDGHAGERIVAAILASAPTV